MAGVLIHTEEHKSVHPVDLVEELVLANEWAFERSNENELVCEISGSSCTYRIYFGWQDELDALYFSCQFDLKVPQLKRAPVYELLALANEKLLVGHFDLCSDEFVPLFRHTLLLRGARGAKAEQVEDLMEIALNECERFYPAFQFVVWSGASPRDAVAAALIETVGEA